MMIKFDSNNKINGVHTITSYQLCRLVKGFNKTDFPIGNKVCKGVTSARYRIHMSRQSVLGPNQPKDALMVYVVLDAYNPCYQDIYKSMVIRASVARWGRARA